MNRRKGELLYYIATCGMLTTRQVCRIAGIGRSGAYKHLRDLKDHGLTEPYGVPYSDLSPPDKPDPGVSWAPGEDIHVATKAGIRWLQSAGFLSDAADAPIPSVPVRGLFLAHEILIRDVRIWLELCTRVHGGEVTYWVDGEAAHFSTVLPDAWFLYKLPSGNTLVGLVEADRKTERGDRWVKKAEGYAKLLGSDEMAEAMDGRRRGRVVVVTLDAARRERIISDVTGIPTVAKDVYCATVDDIAEGGLLRPVWRNAAAAALVPLVPDSAV